MHVYFFPSVWFKWLLLNKTQMCLHMINNLFWILVTFSSFFFFFNLAYNGMKDTLYTQINTKHVLRKADSFALWVICYSPWCWHFLLRQTKGHFSVVLSPSLTHLQGSVGTITHLPKIDANQFNNYLRPSKLTESGKASLDAQSAADAYGSCSPWEWLVCASFVSGS